jgi:PadR family transcriptional regulator PadR
MPYSGIGATIGLEMGEPRVTAAVLGIFAVLAESSGQPRYGLEIAREANLSHTTVYDTLARLEAAGWLRSEWEQIDPRVDARPRRRLYSLTALGEDVARGAPEQQTRALTRMRRPLGLTPQPGGAA